MSLVCEDRFQFLVFGKISRKLLHDLLQLGNALLQALGNLWRQCRGLGHTFNFRKVQELHDLLLRLIICHLGSSVPFTLCT